MACAQLANVLSTEALFYACILPFIAFFGSFAFFMYPLRDVLHPTGAGAPMEHFQGHWVLTAHLDTAQRHFHVGMEDVDMGPAVRQCGLGYPDDVGVAAVCQAMLLCMLGMQGARCDCRLGLCCIQRPGHCAGLRL